MYGNRYGLGLIIATIVGIIIEYKRHKYNKERIALKQQQIEAREHKKQVLLEKMSMAIKPQKKKTRLKMKGMLSRKTINVMFTVILWCLWLTACSTPTRMSGDSKVLIEAEVLRAFEGLVDAARSLDDKAYFAHLDGELLVGVSANGSLWESTAQFKALIQSGFQAAEEVLSLEFSTVKVSVLDARTAILINKFEQQLLLTSGDEVQVQGSGLQVWSKRTGEWKLVGVTAHVK